MILTIYKIEWLKIENLQKIQEKGKKIIFNFYKKHHNN
jgi:hypothetical protein